VVVYKLGPHLKMESAVVQGGTGKEKIFSPRQVLNPGPPKSLWCVATNCTKGDFIPWFAKEGLEGRIGSDEGLAESVTRRRAEQKLERGG
jgi:hypothetical protein